MSQTIAVFLKINVKTITSVEYYNGAYKVELPR